MSLIHPTAIIDPTANLDASVAVGPFCIIEGNVTIGPGTRLGPHVHIIGRTTIGHDNQFHTGCVIGGPPQHLAYKGTDSGVIIGDGNIFREYVTVHRAYHEGQNTVIGNKNFLMANSHVAHDCHMNNSITMANGCLLGGHVHIEDNANISGYVGVHQFVRIGRLAMVGGVIKVTKDIPPFMLVDRDSQVHGLNSIGLRRAGFDLPTRTKIKEAYRYLYRSDLNVPRALDKIEAELSDVAPVMELVAFVRNSVRGICRHAPIARPSALVEAED